MRLRGNQEIILHLHLFVRRRRRDDGGGERAEEGDEGEAEFHVGEVDADAD